MVGLLVGSYLNVVVYRVPRGLSTVTPRSRCPRCNEPIAARDNVPVLSYLLLRGRCRYCRTKISPRYPAVEATTGLLFAACLVRFGPNLDTLVAACFCALLVALALIDVEFFLLPDRLTYPGIGLGLAASFGVSWTNPVTSVLGALLGAAILLGMIGLWLLVRREWGMGLGDVKMLAMIGAFLGMWGMFATLLVSTTAGALVGIALLRSGDGLKTRLPFGVFLSIGALIALFFGQAMISYYLTFF